MDEHRSAVQVFTVGIGSCVEADARQIISLENSSSVHFCDKFHISLYSYHMEQVQCIHYHIVVGSKCRS